MHLIANLTFNSNDASRRVKDTSSESFPVKQELSRKKATNSARENVAN